MLKTEYQEFALVLRRKFTKALAEIYVNHRLYNDSKKQEITRIKTRYIPGILFDEIDDNLEIIQVVFDFLSEEKLNSLFPEPRTPSTIPEFLTTVNFLSQKMPFKSIDLTPKTLCLEIAGGVDFKNSDSHGSQIDAYLAYPRWPAQERTNWGYRVTDRDEENADRYIEKLKMVSKYFGG